MTPQALAQLIAIWFTYDFPHHHIKQLLKKIMEIGNGLPCINLEADPITETFKVTYDCSCIVYNSTLA